MELNQLKQKEKEELDKAYISFLASWISFKEFLEKSKNKKLAIELKEKAKYKKLLENWLKKYKNIPLKFSCLHFLWKKYESEDKENEYWEDFYKGERERENLFI